MDFRLAIFALPSWTRNDCTCKASPAPMKLVTSNEFAGVKRLHRPDGFAGRHAPHEIEHIPHGRGFGDHFALLRGRFFRDVLDGGHHAGELPLLDRESFCALCPGAAEPAKKP